MQSLIRTHCSHSLVAPMVGRRTLPEAGGAPEYDAGHKADNLQGILSAARTAVPR